MWRQIQKQNFIRLSELAHFLEIDQDKLSSSFRFPLNLPKRLAEKIEKGNLEDPLLRQFVPLKDEEQKGGGFSLDPVEDKTFCKTRKLLQKYEGRTLLLATSACAMHCRYCFRQNFDYPKKSRFEEELAHIGEDPTVHEVILSGGDPLSLSDRDLQHLLNGLGGIPHLKIIRFHTRFPLGIPERVTDSLIEIFDTSPKQLIFVLHANHAREFDADVLKALKKMNYPLLLQSVLLKGVNDDFETLKALFQVAIDNGIIPYYLHQLDKVEGAAHFEVEPQRGIDLIEQLRAHLPGYAIPRFVVEIPGKTHKTLVF